eukprot:384260_1
MSLKSKFTYRKLFTMLMFLCIMHGLLYIILLQIQDNEFTDKPLNTYRNSDTAKNKCLNNTNTSTIYLHYNTLNTAFITDITGDDSKSLQTSKCFAFIKSLINIGKWYGKIYLLTDIHKIQIFKNRVPNNVQIISINSTNTNKTNQLQQKIQYIKAIIFDNLKHITEDTLLWTDCNKRITETHCIYDNTYAINITIGSDEWIRYKTSYEHEWHMYRLGDMYKERWQRETWYTYHKERFPNSIAVQYMEQINKTIETSDENVLLHTISSRKQLYPTYNTLVMHVRAGDMLDEICKWIFKGPDRKKMMRMFKDPISLFKQWKSQFIQNNISNVVLVTGFHRRMNHSNTANYIIKIRNWFEENNFSVSFRINENPDQDFMFMCNSKFYIQSPGGFSFLIANIVLRRNGTVFNFGKSRGMPMNSKQKAKCLEKIQT